MLLTISYVVHVATGCLHVYGRFDYGPLELRASRVFCGPGHGLETKKTAVIRHVLCPLGCAMHSPCVS